MRRERGLSQRELSGPGVSAAYISRIENGGRQPSLKALRKLASKLGVTAEYLETGVEGGAVATLELRLAVADLELRFGDDPQAASETLDRVRAEALAAGNVELAQRAGLVLGLAAARRGDHEGAVETLEDVVDAGRIVAHVRPEVFGGLGRSYAALGETRRAVELLERSLAHIEDVAPEDVPLRVRVTTYLSYALGDLGELDRAERVVRAALARADDLADPEARVRLYWSLARRATAEGKRTAALGYARRAIALLEVGEDTLHVARAHLLVALIMASHGTDPAEHLERAEGLLGQHPAPGDMALLRLEQARREALVGAGAGAVARAQEALALLEPHNPGRRGAAWAALAQGLALQGDVDRANDAFRTALELLTESQQWQEAARAARAWGRALREWNRETEALQAFEQAADLAIRADARNRLGHRSARF